MNEKTILAITVAIAPIVLAMARYIYIFLNTSIVERKLFSQNQRFFIAISILALFLSVFIVYSYIAWYYMKYLYRSSYIWRLIVIGIIGIITIGLMFILNTNLSKDVVLIAKSSKNKRYDKYFLRMKTSDGYLSLLDPDKKRTEFISMDELTNYSLEIRTIKPNPKNSKNTISPNENFKRKPLSDSRKAEAKYEQLDK